MSGRTLIKRYGKLLSICSKMLFLFPYGFRLGLFYFVRDIRGYFGVAIRYVIISTLSERIGNNVCIKEGVYIYNIRNLSVGDNVSIHPLCYIDALGGIGIGDNVSIAHNTSLISFDHTYSNKEMPIKYNPLKGDSIFIDNDVWIGCGVRILAGAKIGSRVIVGAGSIVKGVLESNSLYVGIPCKKVKTI